MVPPIVNLAVDFGRLTRKFALRAHEFQLVALEDSLTHLPNRRAFDAALRRGLGSGAQGAVLVVDIDEFKDVNDRLGHEAGDRVLFEVARALTLAMRPGDLVARIGGDEFGIILSDTAASDIPKIAERIRRDVEQQLEESGVTVSIGGSVLAPGLPSYGLADGMLYQAKSRGRNTVVIAGD